MNRNHNKSSQKASLNTFDFDLGLGSNTKPRSLNDQKAPLSSHPKPSSSWLPNTKPSPSWTHQPSLSGPPTSMVGDISGKSWGAKGSSSNIGIVPKDPTLFGDLVGSVLGQGKGSSGNVPLKNAGPVSNGPYSMGGLRDSLPNKGSESVGSFDSFKGSKGPIKSMASGGTGSGKGNDPFVNLVNFGSKQSSGVGNLNKSEFGAFTSGGTGVSNMGSNKSSGSTIGDFGAFASGGTGVNNTGSNKNSSSNIGDFGAFASGGTGVNNTGFNKSSNSTIDDFGAFASGGTGVNNTSFTGSNKSSVPQSQSTGVDPLDNLFSSPSASAGVDDWGLDSEFGGNGGDDVGGTTELEGLPAPPAGVSACSAMNKGMDNYKQGQYPDAIKWLSWAIVLFEKAGDTGATKDVLSSRASCYKEVGEYKKAVADCTKVLEKDDKNVSVLVQRALLYESMEKYKLGAEDLRTVLKIDPLNRIARSTVHRLTKMAE